MPNRTWKFDVFRRLLFVAILIAAAAQGETIADEPGIAPISLFNGKDLSGLSTWLKDSKTADPHKVFRVENGLIHISGAGSGYLATEKEYKDFHLIVEYKWGEKTDGGKFVRNAGILLHATGPDGNAGGQWMSSIECQLAQGCVGDFIPIRGKDEHGNVIPTQFVGEIVLGTDKRPRWKVSGAERVFENGQMWWSRHDPDFKELLDTRGKHDVESQKGEWTKLDCVCEHDTIAVFVNGVKVNECKNVFPKSGKILLQCEGFEWFVRKCELVPLNK